MQSPCANSKTANSNKTVRFASSDVKKNQCSQQKWIGEAYYCYAESYEEEEEEEEEEGGWKR